MTRPTIPTEALVLHGLVADAPNGNGPPASESCSLCGGPPRLCGGLLRCSGAVATPNELRWLTAIRCVYGALLLTPTPASRWGGCLLRMGRLVVAGSTPPAGIDDVAAERAPLFHTAHVSSLPVSLALAYLQSEDLDRLWELRGLLELAFREGSLSPWLDDVLIGVRAALATPLDKVRVFPVFAVCCEKCWGTKARGPSRRLFEHVDTYDQAIRCPGCGEVPMHPLAGVKIGEPHPVGRCVGGAYGARSGCMAHEGYELDREGLCLEGRAVLARAVEEAAAMVHYHKPMDQALADAVMRAQAITEKAQHEADLTAMGNQMERFITDFQARGGTVDAGSLDQVMTTLGGHVRAVVGDAFDTAVTGLLQVLGLDKALGVKPRRKRKKKAKRLGAGGKT